MATAPPTDKQDSTGDGKISDNPQPTDPPMDEQKPDKKMVRDTCHQNFSDTYYFIIGNGI